MLSPETSSFTRFRVWAGAVLCTLALLLPTGIWRDNDVLTISRADIAGLTDGAANEIRRRQHVARDLSRVVPYASGLSLVLGLALIGWAVPSMRRQEGDENKHRAVELEGRRAEVDALIAGTARQPDAEPEPPAPAQPAEAEVNGTVRDLADARHRAIEQIAASRMESRVLLAIQRLANPDWELVPRPRYAGIEPDALLFAVAPDLADVVVEIKAEATARMNPVPSLAEMAAAVGKATGRPTVAWLITVGQTGETRHAVLQGWPHPVVETRVPDPALESITLPRFPRQYSRSVVEFAGGSDSASGRVHRQGSDEPT